MIKGIVNPKILIVEDEQSIQQVICFFLKQYDFDVKGVSGGMEAIQVIQEFMPQLIVLDLVMQPVSGWDVLAWLHAHHLTPQIPVLVMSALVKVRERLHGFEMGAIEYIAKPTQPSKIVERIQSLLAMSVEQRLLLQHERLQEQRQVWRRLSLAQRNNFAY
jgi:DNA-binding response OmpR family regulator